MSEPIQAIAMPSAETFADTYIAANQPVVVEGLDFDAASWTPDTIRSRLGDLTGLVYDTLFELEDISPLEDYLEDWFGQDDLDEDVPYVRWYNKLRDVEFAWGDEAFGRMTDAWRAPACLPTADLLVPVDDGHGLDPVTQSYPYRGILVAARGARTRLHRDPFCTDAVVCVFHGVKEAALYRPERAAELAERNDGSSFGGFADVRADGTTLTVEPDFHGYVHPGEMIYIPHGWLHDVVVAEDSLSVTWNFIHAKGAKEYGDYLADNPEQDSEFEILQYFNAGV